MQISQFNWISFRKTPVDTQLTTMYAPRYAQDSTTLKVVEKSLGLNQGYKDWNEDVNHHQEYTTQILVLCSWFTALGYLVHKLLTESPCMFLHSDKY